MGNGKVFVVIPGFNEKGRVGKVIREVRREGYSNIVFIDDGSYDGCASEARQAGATVLRHIINMGKGAAARTGCDYAVSKGAEIICLMDADGQHKASDLRKIVAALRKNRSDIVFGFRKLDRNMPIVMLFGNWFIDTATGIIEGVWIKDTQCGFRCFTAKAYKKIVWHSKDYSLESEVVSHAARHKLKYSQVPIKTIYHDKFKGTTVFDGIKIFINIVRFRLFD